MKKKLLSVALCVAMAATALAGCGSKSSDDKDTTASSKESSSKGSVYFLNFKPEISKDYEDIMKKFTDETGIKAKVVTAAENQYESTLKVEMAKSDAPTLFTVNGPVGYNRWKDYCDNLKDTKLYSMLTDKTGAISTDEGVFGIPLMMETYGLICNKDIFAKYFALSDKADTGCTKIEDINNFTKLKAVVEDMQKHKSDLDIDGVFTEIALNSDNDWRLTNHLFCLPLYYEYQKDNVKDKQELSFSFAEQFKNIIDLYLDNGTVAKSNASSGSVDDAMLEFATGKAAIAQNGTWAWGQINKEKVPDTVITEDKLYYMPIYTGAEGEESQGLCTGTENFVCINKKASDDDKEASAKFLEWLYTSEEGKKFVSKNYGVAPFEGFDNSEAEKNNPLVKLALADVNNTATKTVNWVTTTSPSQDWKNSLGQDLLSYAEGSLDWDKVISNAIDKWKTEKAAANN